MKKKQVTTGKRGAKEVKQAVKKRPMGKPRFVWDDRTKSIIVSALKMGLTLDDACFLANAKRITLHDFVARVEKALTTGESNVTKEDIDFYTEIKKSRAELKVRLLKKIDDAAEKNWQAAAWRLERGFPDEFGRKFNEAKVTVDRANDKVIVEVVVPDELRL